MSESTILWILGALMSLVLPALGYLAHRIAAVEKGLADFRAEVPVRYANEGDILRVEASITALRGQVDQYMTEQRAHATSVAATLNQLVGASTHRG